MISKSPYLEILRSSGADFSTDGKIRVWAFNPSNFRSIWTSPARDMSDLNFVQNSYRFTISLLVFKHLLDKFTNSLLVIHKFTTSSLQCYNVLLHKFTIFVSPLIVKTHFVSRCVLCNTFYFCVTHNIFCFRATHVFQI